MKLPAILTSDPHFTASPKDEYKWGVFPFLAAQCAEEKARTLVINGDLTDQKDYHPSSLTNRLVSSIMQMRDCFEEVIINMGNHDYLREGHAYFAFLSSIPGVHFITKPAEFMLDNGPSALFLPHNKNPAAVWKGMDFSHYDYLFIHQTVKGSMASNGQEMDGEDLPPLNAGKVWAGDIHVPQVVGAVEYIGSPYHVHFGDRFKPRCILIDRRKRHVDLHFETISRFSLKITSASDLKAVGFKPGDQVKVKIELSEAEAHEWSARRRAVTEYLRRAEVEVHGVELVVVNRSQRRLIGSGRPMPQATKINAAEAVFRFVQRHELGAEAVDMGLELLK